jgi:hypothetical protein
MSRPFLRTANGLLDGNLYQDFDMENLGTGIAVGAFPSPKEHSRCGSRGVSASMLNAAAEGKMRER